MTMEIEDVALERLLNGPAPYGSDRRPHPITAQQDLSLALEGQAPRLSQFVLDRLGPAKTAELAQVIRRAVAVGIRRRGEDELRERLEGAYDLLVDGLNQVTDGCTTPERECSCAVLNDDGDCTVCGEHWESLGMQECERCFDAVTTLSSSGLCDGCQAEVYSRG